ncbi:hypothetical protein [Aquibacillus saliphilus]|nr:hypothetical protein [Aquibacillus saliphilus]
MSKLTPNIKNSKSKKPKSKKKVSLEDLEKRIKEIEKQLGIKGDKT